MLDVENVFIEQRFLAGARTGKVELIDSLEIRPKLVIVMHNNSTIGSTWEISINLREAPFGSAGRPGRNVFALSLTKEQLHKPFALRVTMNKEGISEDFNLVVQPHPVAQAWDESYNSTQNQSELTGVLLARCAVQPPAVAASNGLRLHVQEAFIERRFEVGTLTHEVRPLDSPVCA